MTVSISLIFILCFSNIVEYISGQDVYSSINTKKSSHIVDERFISVVVDPLVLLSGLNISSQTLTLARHLSPAFLRISGPSSSAVSFTMDEPAAREAQAHPLDPAGLCVSPATWAALNAWIANARLTPVFTLSDLDRVGGAWNPKAEALPLMALTDRMGVPCYWELTNAAPNKTLQQYVVDITSLRHILDAFPASRSSWGIAGGELSQWTSSAPDTADVIRKLLADVSANVDAVNWTPKIYSGPQYPAKISKVIPFGSRNNPSLWTTAPRSPKPTSFKDGLLWAHHLGHAASMGYDVIFRQPKIEELFEITPAYWISIFHKSLMGRNVLDIRTVNTNKKDCHIYAHCAKGQDRFVRKGAVTVMAVNMENQDVNVSLKFVGARFRNADVESYVLTSTDPESSEIYLNGEILTVSDLQIGKYETMPKVQRTRASKSLLLNLPSKSIGFFVIPSACLSACILGEPELHAHRQETTPAQQDAGSETTASTSAPSTVNEQYRARENQLASNEKYYKSLEYLKKMREWKAYLEREKQEQSEMNNSNNSVTGDKSREAKMSDDARKLIIDQTKRVERQRNAMEAEQRRLLTKRGRTEKNNPTEQLETPIELHMSRAEIEKLLDDKLNVNEYKKEQHEVINRTDDELIKQNENKMDFSREYDAAHLDLLKKLAALNSEAQIKSRKRRDAFSSGLPPKRINRATGNSVLKTEVSNADAAISTAPEFACACKSAGNCACGLQLANNIIQKYWTPPSKEDLKKYKEIWEKNKQSLEKIPQGNMSFEHQEATKQKEQPDEIQEIKSLLRQYHDEIKNIVSWMSLKDIVESKDKSQEKNNVETENLVNKSVDVNLTPEVNLVPKERIKRKFSTKLIEQDTEVDGNTGNSDSVEKINKNILHDKNESWRLQTQVRRLKRASNFLKNKINQEVKSKKNLEIKNDMKDNAEITTPDNTATCALDENIPKNNPHTTPTDDEDLEKATKTENSKLKALNRKLAHQLKLEQRIANYLQKIKDSTNHLTEEIHRFSRSAPLDNNDNERSDYVMPVPLGVGSKTQNFNPNNIFDDFDGSLSGELRREHDQYKIEIVKRELPYSVETVSNEIISNKRKRETTILDDDRTKESDSFRNEISKEGAMLPNSVKEQQEDTYMIKPKKLRKEQVNEISKSGNIISKENDDYMYEKNKSKVDFSAINLVDSKKSSNSMDKQTSTLPYTVSSTTITDSNLSSTELPMDSDEFEDTSSDLNDEFITDDDLTGNSKHGLVNNLFHTMYGFLNGFHRKIMDYIKLLA